MCGCGGVCGCGGGRGVSSLFLDADFFGGGGGGGKFGIDGKSDGNLGVAGLFLLGRELLISFEV